MEAQLTDSPQRYGTIPQFLHWMTVVLVIVAWTLGIFGDDLPKGGVRAAGLFIHVSAGLLILIALIMRLAARIAVPPPPPRAERIQQMARCSCRPFSPSCPVHALCSARRRSCHGHRDAVCAWRGVAAVRIERDRIALDTR